MPSEHNTQATPAAGGERSGLHADCASCFGLCCVALPFTASADFAVDKDAGEPCANLREDFGCGIHANLRERGFPGCVAFDCFGAGQQVSQVTFAGQDWREAPHTARRMFEVLPVMRQLHELLWYVTESLERPAARPVHRDLRAMRTELEDLVGAAADALAGLDVAPLRARVSPLLERVSEMTRAAEVPGRRRNHRGADLLGARLSGATLRGASLRGACLIAADLSGADLRAADLLGADFRDADLSGADLTGGLFLTQSQVGAARGDTAIRLPAALDRPPHWL